MPALIAFCYPPGVLKSLSNPMSWSINSIGSPAAVAAEISKNTNLSPKLRDALLEICGEPPYSGSGNDAIEIEGNGHGGDGSYIYGLKMRRLTLAKEPVAAAPDLSHVVSPLST